MAVETPRARRGPGLDQLELAPPQQAKRHVAGQGLGRGLAQAAGPGAAPWPSGSWSTSAASRAGSCPARRRPCPTCGTSCTRAQLWPALGTTLRRAVIGFALALVIGTVVGALVSRIRPLRAAVGSLITALQTLPSIVWVPFAIILFGATTHAILFVIVMTAAPAIANGLIAGADFLPPLLLRAGKTMGLRRLSLYRHVIMPATLPAFVGGLKQGWAFGWHGLIAGESRGHHPRPALARRAAEQRPGPGGDGLGDRRSSS